VRRANIKQLLEKFESKRICYDTTTLFDAGGCRSLRVLLHQSLRTFGKPTSRWALTLAAEISFA